ncbi:MAG: hypothetical protein JXA66_02265 [Oligoflexia bacterium]|nr:hypothetical protein [Oligoflexia bacterium]
MKHCCLILALSFVNVSCSSDFISRRKLSDEVCRANKILKLKRLANPEVLALSTTRQVKGSFIIHKDELKAIMLIGRHELEKYPHGYDQKMQCSSRFCSLCLDLIKLDYGCGVIGSGLPSESGSLNLIDDHDVFLLNSDVRGNKVLQLVFAGLPAMLVYMLASKSGAVAVGDDEAYKYSNAVNPSTREPVIMCRIKDNDYFCKATLSL